MCHKKGSHVVILHCIGEEKSAMVFGSGCCFAEFFRFWSP